MARITGRDIKSLRALAVVLARACIFGDNVLLQSSPSGKGYATCQLEPEKLAEIRVRVQQRARHLSDNEFEAV